MLVSLQGFFFLFFLFLSINNRFINAQIILKMVDLGFITNSYLPSFNYKHNFPMNIPILVLIYFGSYLFFFKRSYKIQF
jgi:hypothetical protein